MNQLTVEEIVIINRMADLMEQGSLGKRQITGQYFEIDGNGVCAMGACLTAVGAEPRPSDGINLKAELGIQEWPKVMYPADTQYWRWIYDIGKPVYLDDAIISLNDVAGWDFAHIVLWLRQVASEATIPQNA